MSARKERRNGWRSSFAPQGQKNSRTSRTRSVRNNYRTRISGTSLYALDPLGSFPWRSLHLSKTESESQGLSSRMTLGSTG